MTDALVSEWFYMPEDRGFIEFNLYAEHESDLYRGWYRAGQFYLLNPYHVDRPSEILDIESHLITRWRYLPDPETGYFPRTRLNSSPEE